MAITRASVGNVIFITTTGNVHVASWILFLDVMQSKLMIMINNETEEEIKRISR